eukprot:UN05210
MQFPWNFLINRLNWGVSYSFVNLKNGSFYQ